MRLFFVRHGKPKILNNEFYEARLSDEGAKRARQLARSGSVPRPDSVFSSPYKRARDTASEFCAVFGLGLEVREFLREWNLQSLNLPDPEYSLETQRGWEDRELRVQGGESLREVQERAYEGTMQIASSSAAESILFVSHGTLIEMLCARVGRRQPLQRNVEDMDFLAWAAFEFKDGALKLTKDASAT